MPIKIVTVLQIDILSDQCIIFFDSIHLVLVKHTTRLSSRQDQLPAMSYSAQQPQGAEGCALQKGQL